MDFDLPKKTEEVFEKLRKGKLLAGFYLAGGTAASLYLGHRISEDLDFFTQKELNTSQMIQRLKSLGRYSLFEESWGTVSGSLDGIKVSFFTYQYPMLGKFKSLRGVKVADLIDIGLMKITAISGRGSKRDFIDLYFISKKIALRRLLARLPKKYKEYNQYHVLRSLSYFKDAEIDVVPNMKIPKKWTDVKEFFKKEIRTI